MVIRTLRNLVIRFRRIAFVCVFVARRIPVTKIPSDLSSVDVEKTHTTPLLQQYFQQVLLLATN